MKFSICLWIVSLSNLAFLVPIIITKVKKEKVLLSLTMIFSFLHHITATNRVLSPLFESRYSQELLWADRLFAGLCIIYAIASRKVPSKRTCSWIVLALSALFYAEVCRDLTNTNELYRYTTFHTFWHVAAAILATRFCMKKF